MGIGCGILYRIISVLVIAAVSGLLTYATARAAPCTLTPTEIYSYLAGSSPLRISHRASSPMIATGRSARDNASTIAVATVIPRSVDSDP